MSCEGTLKVQWTSTGSDSDYPSPKQRSNSSSLQMSLIEVSIPFPRCTDTGTHSATSDNPSHARAKTIFSARRDKPNPPYDKTMHLYVVCYDILHQGVRTKVAHLLGRYGARKQESVAAPSIPRSSSSEVARFALSADEARDSTIESTRLLRLSASSNPSGIP
jgi:CRISPR/Cas system-associated endoribonuclease Cas2